MARLHSASRLMRHWLLAVSVGVTLVHAEAQEFPSRPIKLVVPYPAGGTLDIVGRNIGKLAEPSLGQPIVVDNVPGATGVIAHSQIARASADGYTIGISGLSPLAPAPHQYKNLAYKPLKDFSYVACFGDTPLVLNVATSLPVRTVQELVAYAQANLGKLNYGSAGIGNATYLAAALFARQAGIEAKLNAAVNKVVADPAVKEHFAAQGSNLYESTPQGCDALARKEYAQWARTFSELNIKPE